MRITYKHKKSEHPLVCFDLKTESKNQINAKYFGRQINYYEWMISHIEGLDIYLPKFYGVKTLLRLQKCLEMGIPPKVIEAYIESEWGLFLTKIIDAHLGKYESISIIEVLRIFGGLPPKCIIFPGNNDYYVFDLRIATTL